MNPVTRNNRFGHLCFSVAIAVLCGVALAAVSATPAFASDKKHERRIRAEDDPLYRDAAPRPGTTRSEDDPLYMDGYVAPLQDRPARRAAVDDDDSTSDGPWFGPPQLWRDDHNRGRDGRMDHEPSIVDRGDDPRTWN